MKIKAFTLAELLVSLTIIGVIAALTTPVVITRSQEKEFFVAYRKAFAVGNEAMEYVIARGKYKELGARFDSSEGAAIQKENFKEFSNFFLKRKECFDGNNSECWNPDGEKLYKNSQPSEGCLAFTDQSGMAWSLYSNSENITLVDTNGNKGPNHYGKDRWYFVPVNAEGVREGANGPNGKAVGLGVYYPPNDDGITNLYDITGYSASWCQYPPCKIKTALTEG